MQDPLAELVKVPPQSLGVGQYQHDLPAEALASALGATVEDCVNLVGVDLNAASGSPSCGVCVRRLHVYVYGASASALSFFLLKPFPPFSLHQSYTPYGPAQVSLHSSTGTLGFVDSYARTDVRV